MSGKMTFSFFVLTFNCINHIIQLKKLYYLTNTVKGEKVMISFEEFMMQEGSPIYQQILLYIKRGVIAGNISDGDELPSRRVLSALLGVNPNTVQKAYRLLEEENLIQTLQGSKSTMALTTEKIVEIREELLEADAKGAVQKLKQMGISKKEAIGLIEKYWESTEKEESEGL